jgi:hypothetical protein
MVVVAKRRRDGHVVQDLDEEGGRERVSGSRKARLNFTPVPDLT